MTAAQTNSLKRSSGTAQTVRASPSRSARPIRTCCGRLFRTARDRDQFALIESTSNQVDQYGGYTGMKPADFVAMVHAIAEEEGFPKDRILLGGDHLGPNRWQKGPAEKAMTEAETLMAAYVEAGYEKIHLDASFVCADDTAPLSDEIVASRCVRLAKVCEAHAGKTSRSTSSAPRCRRRAARSRKRRCTPPRRQTPSARCRCSKARFRDAGLKDAWSRVVGLVVQPGVEFSDDEIADYPGDQGLEGRDPRAMTAWSSRRIRPTTRRRPISGGWSRTISSFSRSGRG